MKRLYTCLTGLLIAVTLISCKKNIDGKWDDNIKLSAKEISLESTQTSEVITTKSTSWWLNSISLDGKPADLSKVDKLSKNFLIKESEFEIERKDDGRKIIVSMSPNKTNSDRILIISLQNGDYFSGVKVTQKK